jgi:hypothetical protein
MAGEDEGQTMDEMRGDVQEDATFTERLSHELPLEVL